MRSRQANARLELRRVLRRGAVALVALLCLASLPATAALAAAEDGEDEPGVARVSLIEGEASYLRGDADEWTGVSVNAPLVTGDRFFSGADSRAEIQLAPGIYARLSSETALGMLELGPDTTQVRLSAGLVTLRLRRPPGDRHVEIDTPGAAAVLREAGIYRVQVDRAGDTTLQVRDGEATVYVAGEPYEIRSGRGVRVEGTGDEARPSIYSVAGGDGWDQWDAERARRVENAESYRYVSEDIYGAEDLDEYGDWEYRSEYGYVWRPRYVGAGWAPYTYGRWVWVDPWGWTWLGYEPWGWAPYHYGRWVYLDSYWAWAPGPIIASPIYAPALVGWFGSGFGGVSVSVGFGSIGWVPLGWGEPCFPWWGGWGGVRIGWPWWGGWGGPRIFNNVVINKNITNITINKFDFGNLRKPGGFSTVPVRDFLCGGRGRFMPPGAGRSDFRPIDGRVPVVPTRESLPATSPGRVGVGRTVQPPREVLGRQVVSTRAPGVAPPSFERKLPVVERNAGAPLTPATLRDLGREGGGRTLVRTAAPGGTGSGGRSLAGGEGRTLPGVQTSRREAPGALDVAPSARREAGSGVPSTAWSRSRDGSWSRSVPEPAAPRVRPEAFPTAPREGGERERYVARRPARSGLDAAPESRSAPTSRTPRSTWTSGDRAPRSSGEPSARTAPQARSGSRQWFSQPRTLAPSGRETRAAPRSSGGSGTVPMYRSGPPSSGAAPRVRSAPAPSRSGGSAPNVSSAPRTSSVPRSYSAPRGSFSGRPSAPAVRSFSGRGAPSVSRSFGGTSRSFGGMSRSFGGSSSFGGGRSVGGGRSSPAGGR